jgi:TPR repeat protein
MHLPVTKAMRGYARSRKESAICGEAQRGDLQAMVDCGEMLSGDYSNRDRDDKWARKAQGLALLHRAAERGHAEAQYEMGREAEEQKEYVEAFRWYLKSATQGYPDAKSSVAFAYWLGQGTEEDLEEARRWFYEAAYDGDAMAAESLGDIFRKSKTPWVSYRWYRIAECYGNRPGYTDSIRRMLTPQQVADGDQNAIRFVKEHHKLYSNDGTCRW